MIDKASRKHENQIDNSCECASLQGEPQGTCVMFKGMPDRVSLHVRLILVFVTAIALLSLVHCVPKIPSEPSEETAPVFKRNCLICHSLEKALKVTKDQSAWEETARLMNEEQHGAVLQGEIRGLIGLHGARRNKDREIVFRECDQCHVPMPLRTEVESAADRHTAIRRMLAKKMALADDQDAELPIHFHLRDQRLRAARMLRRAIGSGSGEKTPEEPRIVEVFVEKCSACHNLERALAAEKDEDAWRRTIAIMSGKRGSPLKPNDVEALVRLHVERQKTEQEVFRQDCAKCHPAERALEKIMTKNEWRDTVKRMAARASAPMSDEEIDLVTNFHIGNFKKMEERFQFCCTQCHDLEKATTVSGDNMTMEKTIVSMVERTGGKISYDDVKKLVAFHMERKNREQALFEKDCTACHPAETSLGKSKSREGWRATIERMQAKAPAVICDDEIEILVAYHVKKARGL